MEAIRAKIMVKPMDLNICPESPFMRAKGR